MPVTRRQKKLGLRSKPYIPIDNLCLALKFRDDLETAIRRQILKNERRRPGRELDWDAANFDEILTEWNRVSTGADRESTWKETIKEAVKFAPPEDTLTSQLKEYEDLDIQPKISMKMHRFIRIYEENAALIRRGY